MRFFVIVFFLLPNILFAQSNELYKLLKWNNKSQQQQLIVWYDLQDASTIKKNNSSPGTIFGINDKSIWKNHINQRESNFQPILTTENGFANGPKNGISFSNGGYMVYNFPTEKTVNTITSFVVCKNNLGGSKLMYDLSIEGGEGIASCYSGLYKIESRVPNSLADFIPNFSNNPEKILIISTKGSSGKINSYLNSSNYSGSGTRNFKGTSYNRIRLSTAQGVAPTDGTLYELILFDYELSDEEFYLVKKYLEDKYQLNANISINNQNSTNSISTYRSALIEGKVNNPTSNASSEINDPEINKKEFAKLLTRFESTNSTNSKFSGNIRSYPSNPSESYYKKDYYNNQLIYDGYMKEIINSSSGNTIYKQQFKHGRGKEYFINSTGYQEGFFVNGKLNGYGEHISNANGFSYKGYFENGVRSGEGILVMDGINGTTKYIYEGTFLNGKYNGKGTLTYKSMSYTGDFVNDLMSGKGVCLYLNGDKYVGSFVNGRWEGYGEYYWANGDFYKGDFSNNMRNGNGELAFANGTKQKGLFENGNFIGEKKVEVKQEFSSNSQKSALIEGKFTTSRVAENSVDINCSYKFNIPKTAWKLVDNRKICISCRKRYVSYSKNDLVDAKKNATAAIIRANLIDHLNKLNASAEHKRSDEKRLNQFLAMNNFGMMGILSSIFQASMGEMKGVLFGDKKALLNEIDLYVVEKSRFCSPTCEYYYNHR
jgi:hypothetical protein